MVEQPQQQRDVNICGVKYYVSSVKSSHSLIFCL